MRPEREERVLRAAQAVGIARVGDEVVPVVVPAEERPHPGVDRPARGEGVDAGRQPDRNRQEDRAEPDEPDEADGEDFAAALHRAELSWRSLQTEALCPWAARRPKGEASI